MDFTPVGIVAVLLAGLFVFSIFSSNADDQSEVEKRRDWLESNVEDNYTVSDVTLDFPDGYPDYENSKERFFTVEGFSDDLHDRVATEGYLNFDEQVVVISDDVNGAVVPVDGSDAERVLVGSNAE